MGTTRIHRPFHPDDYLARAMKRCESADELLEWLELFCKLRVPTKPVCPHHDAPFEYIRRAYVEPAQDLIVWAPRGGGKTRLGAAATLLDLLHKPGVSVRIIAGSLEQSLRMWEQLEPDLRTCAQRILVGYRPGRHAVHVGNGSMAAVL